VLLKIGDLDVGYGNVPILRGINLEVDKGEIITILGPNGAGKSTLLKAITGMLKPTRGSIEYLGERINGKKTHYIVKKGISLVPEGREIFKEFTTLENLMIGAYVSKRKEDVNELLDGVYRLFPILKERINQNANTLSGGEQQMLAIARALMSRPKLLLMDEPSMGLAPLVVQTVFELIKRINEEGMTIILVEQNARISLQIADRAYILDLGKIAFEGVADELMGNDQIKTVYLGL
jgi:branched-chain amino acid transport system ATP-binding protein